MNARAALAFVVVLAVLFGVVLGLDQFKVGQATPTPTANQDESVALFQFDDRKATTVTVRSADKTSSFEKSGDTWKITGSEDPANALSVSSLLIRMSQMKGTRKIDAPDLTQFGLAEPKGEVTVVLDDGSTNRLLLGDKTPVSTGYYAKNADAPGVTVIPTQFGADVERLANDPKEPATPTPRPTPTESLPASGTPGPAAGTPTP
ncbi:MAG: DUF4340 domain-containing protein [Chloroflexi bacterium]|nr:DUF4340 domain-containing protein [Chloroflexota bacterium]